MADIRADFWRGEDNAIWGHIWFDGVDSEENQKKVTKALDWMFDNRFGDSSSGFTYSIRHSLLHIDELNAEKNSTQTDVWCFFDDKVNDAAQKRQKEDALFEEISDKLIALGCSSIGVPEGITNPELQELQNQTSITDNGNSVSRENNKEAVAEPAPAPAPVASVAHAVAVDKTPAPFNVSDEAAEAFRNLFADLALPAGNNKPAVARDEAAIAKFIKDIEESDLTYEEMEFVPSYESQLCLLSIINPLVRADLIAGEAEDKVIAAYQKEYDELGRIVNGMNEDDAIKVRRALGLLFHRVIAASDGGKQAIVNGIYESNITAQEVRTLWNTITVEGKEQGEELDLPVAYLAFTDEDVRKALVDGASRADVANNFAGEMVTAEQLTADENVIGAMYELVKTKGKELSNQAIKDFNNLTPEKKAEIQEFYETFYNMSGFLDTKEADKYKENLALFVGLEGYDKVKATSKDIMIDWWEDFVAEADRTPSFINDYTAPEVKDLINGSNTSEVIEEYIHIGTEKELADVNGDKEPSDTNEDKEPSVVGNDKESSDGYGEKGTWYHFDKVNEWQAAQGKSEEYVTEKNGDRRTFQSVYTDKGAEEKFGESVKVYFKDMNTEENYINSKGGAVIDGFKQKRSLDVHIKDLDFEKALTIIAEEVKEHDTKIFNLDVADDKNFNLYMEAIYAMKGRGYDVDISYATKAKYAQILKDNQAYYDDIMQANKELAEGAKTVSSENTDKAVPAREVDKTPAPFNVDENTTEAFKNLFDEKVSEPIAEPAPENAEASDNKSTLESLEQAVANANVLKGIVDAKTVEAEPAPKNEAEAEINPLDTAKGASDDIVPVAPAVAVDKTPAPFNVDENTTEAFKNLFDEKVSEPIAEPAPENAEASDNKSTLESLEQAVANANVLKGIVDAKTVEAEPAEEPENTAESDAEIPTVSDDEHQALLEELDKKTAENSELQQVLAAKQAEDEAKKAADAAAAEQKKAERLAKKAAERQAVAEESARNRAIIEKEMAEKAKIDARDKAVQNLFGKGENVADEDKFIVGGASGAVLAVNDLLENQNFADQIPEDTKASFYEYHTKFANAVKEVAEQVQGMPYPAVMAIALNRTGEWNGFEANPELAQKFYESLFNEQNDAEVSSEGNEARSLSNNLSGVYKNFEEASFSVDKDTVDNAMKSVGRTTPQKKAPLSNPARAGRIFARGKDNAVLQKFTDSLINAYGRDKE